MLISAVGTFRTWLIWPTMSAIGGEADKSRPKTWSWIWLVESAGRDREGILDYGFSLHHLGHLTLRGVRVAFTTIR
jgi:hypothetical protein